MARRALSAALGCLVLLAAAAACTGRGGDARTVVFWGLGREGEVVRDLVPEFEREHPGLTVRVQQIPWTAAHEKLLTSFVGGSTPDVAQLGNTWIPEFAAIGAIVPLDPVRAEGYFPGILATNVVGGKTYGLPWYVDTRVLFYRRDLLAAAGFPAPPRTWDEWLAQMRAIKARAGAHGTAILLPLDEWEQIAILGMQAGSPLLEGGGRHGAFAAAAFRRAARFYAGLFDEGLAPRAAITQIANLYQQFAAGDFAFYVTGPWNVGEFRRRIPAAQQSCWATAPLPHPDAAAGVPGASFAGGSSLVIFRGARNPEGARAFVDWLERPEVQLRFFELTGDLPGRREAWADPRLSGDDRIGPFGVQLEYARPLPPVPEWQQIAQKIADRLDTSIRGGVPLDTALAALDADVERVLEKRRFLLDRAAAGR